MAYAKCHTVMTLMKDKDINDMRRTLRKLQLAVNANTHDIVPAESSLSNVTDARALPTLLKQTYRKIIEISTDGAYDTRDCYNASHIERAAPPYSTKNQCSLLEEISPK